MSRIYAVVFAAVGWFALALQLYVVARDNGGTLAGLLRALWSLLRFFTILTNVLVAVALTRAALGRPENPRLATGLAISIALVGLVYTLVLRAVWDPQGLQLVADHLLHDVMPPAYVLYWAVFVPRRAVSLRDVPWWTLYPVTYTVYALLRGALGDKYAYPFLDVRAIGVGRMLLNALAILVVFLLLGASFVALDRWLGRAGRRTHSPTPRPPA